MCNKFHAESMSGKIDKDVSEVKIYVLLALSRFIDMQIQLLLRWLQLIVRVMERAAVVRLEPGTLDVLVRSCLSSIPLHPHPVSLHVADAEEVGADEVPDVVGSEDGVDT